MNDSPFIPRHPRQGPLHRPNPIPAKVPTPAPKPSTPSIQDRDVVIGKISTKLSQAINQSNTFFAQLPPNVQSIVARALEHKITQGSGVLKSSNETTFHAEVAESVDFGLMVATLEPSQQQVVKLLLGKARESEIKEAILLRVLNPTDCNTLMQSIHQTDDTQIKQSLLNSFIDSFPAAIANARYTKMQNAIQAKGFNIIPAKDDGNCFYDALIKSGIILTTEESQNPQMLLRREIQTAAENILGLYYTPTGTPTDFRQEVRQNTENIKPRNETAIFLWNEFTDYNNLKSLIQSGNITKDKEWADSTYAILVALATGHPVHLYSPKSTDTKGNFVPQIFDINADGTRLTTSPISITFNGHNHFDGLTPPRRR